MVPLTKGGSDATRMAVVVVVAARAESNLIARSCFVLRSGGDGKIVMSSFMIKSYWLQKRIIKYSLSLSSLSSIQFSSISNALSKASMISPGVTKCRSIKALACHIVFS